MLREERRVQKHPGNKSLAGFRHTWGALEHSPFATQDLPSIASHHSKREIKKEKSWCFKHRQDLNHRGVSLVYFYAVLCRRNPTNKPTIEPQRKEDTTGYTKAGSRSSSDPHATRAKQFLSELPCRYNKLICAATLPQVEYTPFYDFSHILRVML